MATKQTELAPGEAGESTEDLRTQVRTLSALVERLLDDQKGQKEAEAKLAEANPLPTAKSEEQRMLAFWASEEKVQIFIAPDEDDKKAAKAMRTHEFPPQTFQVNGVQIAVPKGKPTYVPRSIADLWSYMLDPWSARNVPKPHTFEEAEARLEALA